MAELPHASIEPRSAGERVLVVVEPVARNLVWVGRVVGFVVRISIVAAVPVLIVGLFAWFG